MPMLRLFLLLPALLLVASLARAEVDPLRGIIDLAEAPPGVVIEIVAGDEAFLNLALPQVEQLTARLRARFPELPVAVVSHGGEQFGLASTAIDSHVAAHSSAQKLAAAEVPVHVCGTHASWRNLADEDFPAYVDVAPTGPGQIRAYEALGYLLIEL